MLCCPWMRLFYSLRRAISRVFVHCSDVWQTHYLIDSTVTFRKSKEGLEMRRLDGQEKIYKTI